MSNHSLSNNHVAVAAKKYKQDHVGPIGNVGKVLLAAAYTAGKKK